MFKIENRNELRSYYLFRGHISVEHIIYILRDMCVFVCFIYNVNARIIVYVVDRVNEATNLVNPTPSPRYTSLFLMS